jgi:hypothetical protein
MRQRKQAEDAGGAPSIKLEPSIDTVSTWKDPQGVRSSGFASLLSFSLLLLLFISSALLVSECEGAPAAALNTTGKHAFTAEHGDLAKKHVQTLSAMGPKMVGTTQVCCLSVCVCVRASFVSFMLAYILTCMLEYANTGTNTHVHTYMHMYLRTCMKAEHTAPEYIRQQLKLIRSKAHRDIKVEIAVMRPSGSFNTDFLGGINAVYDNVTNVICRISSKQYERGVNDSLLINAHFDTTMGSPGAGDDLSQVGIALEIGSLLATGAYALPRAVILLFNGAEEFNWLAAHGFITSSAPLEFRTASDDTYWLSNTWSHTVRAVVNLEAMGSGGRALLTRTTPGAGWMTRAYKRSVQLPRANVIADDIFRAKVFPGDTDLRVFRDFGGLQGIDIIFVEDGYSYHTPQDEVRRIRAADLARAGGQLLALTVELVHDLEKSVEAGVDLEMEEQVFFDVLGLFLVAYNASLGVQVNWAASAVGVLSYVLLSRCCVGQTGGVLQALASFFAPLLAAVSVGVVMNGMSALSWYSESRLCFLLYLSPAAAAAMWAASDKKPYDGKVGDTHVVKGQVYLNPWRELAIQVRGVLLLFSLLLALMNAAQLRSAYVMLVCM